MPTQLRSDTARANGAKSHGPATAEGRETSSRNAVKHGLYSRNPLVLECENDDDFEALHRSQMEIHQPATPAEKDLVDQMVAARWRVLRLQALESEILDSEMRQNTELERESGSDRTLTLSNAYITQVNNSQALALASRCESRFHRIYLSLYKVLRELQTARARQSTQPAAPEPAQPEPPPPPIAAEPATSHPSEEQKCSNEPKPAPEIQNPTSKLALLVRKPHGSLQPSCSED